MRALTLRQHTRHGKERDCVRVALIERHLAAVTESEQDARGLLRHADLLRRHWHWRINRRRIDRRRSDRDCINWGCVNMRNLKNQGGRRWGERRLCPARGLARQGMTRLLPPPAPRPLHGDQACAAAALSRDSTTA